MSTQSEINRIKAARDSIAAKIRAKGVSVPTTVKIDELPDYVESISTSEDLSTELTEQANLIAQQQTLISNLETALENKAGGSGGGASIETCDVTIGVWFNSTGLSISRIIYTTVENGKISNKIHVCENKSQGFVTGDVISLDHEITLSCIVGTSVYMFDENITMPSYVTSDNVTFNGNADDWGLVFEAVIDSGSTATISAEL